MISSGLAVPARATHGRAARMPEPSAGPLLLADSRLAVSWIVVRLYVAYRWLAAGRGKVASPAGVRAGGQAGAAPTGYLKRALARADGGRPGVQPFGLAALISVAALAGRAEAHEKWFQDPAGLGLRWDLFARPGPIALVAAVLAITAAAWLLYRARGDRGFLPGPAELGATPERRAALYGVLPAILAAHLAVPLLVLGVQGRLFTPNNEVQGFGANLFGLAQAGIALSLFYGGFARAGAIALGLTWLVGALVTGLEPALESALILGFAAFFYLAGRGPIAVDRLIAPRLEPAEELMRWAMPALRVGVGASLSVVAFTEKLANQPLALTFLQRYPLNFTGALGVPVPDETFALLAGGVELLVGLWIMLGVFPREIILVAWLPFNLTLTVFDWTELVGHLPVYGALAALLVWEPGRANLELWVAGLRRGPLAVQAPATGQARPSLTTPSPEPADLAVGPD